MNMSDSLRSIMLIRCLSVIPFIVNSIASVSRRIIPLLYPVGVSSAKDVTIGVSLF